jgi:hypothetical protein
LAAEFANQGQDWETELRQIAKEKKLMKELGLTDSDIKINPKQQKETANE